MTLCVSFYLLFVQIVVVGVSNISAYNGYRNTTDYIEDSKIVSWKEIANVQSQPNDLQHDLILEYYSIATNTSNERYPHMGSIYMDVPRAAFIGALIAIAAMMLIVAISKLLKALSRTICKLHDHSTNQHDANTSSNVANHNVTNTPIWSITHGNNTNLMKILDDRKHIPFKFDEVNYFNGGGMESGFIPEVARYYRDVVGGSEAYNASTLSSSMPSHETITDEFSDDYSTGVSVDTFELDLCGFQEVIIDQ